MSLRVMSLFVLAFGLGLGCSLVYDWDDEDALPCPCKPDYVCLVSTDICVKKGSVDDYKSCTPDAEFPDDLCQQGSRCFDRESFGPRCLPRCVPVRYITPDVGELVRSQCGPARTCWQAEGGGAGDGVCDDGECAELSQDCGSVGEQCAAFNLAGVCFTTCKMFGQNRGCLGGQVCHPLGASSVTACVDSGLRASGELCSDTDPCQKQDSNGRDLICDRPEGSSDQRRCLKACEFPASIQCYGGETCQFARPNIDRDIPDKALGVCIQG